MSAQKPTVYAFIDSQNLNLGVRSQGWTLDFKKFRLYLKNKYGVEKAYKKDQHRRSVETLGLSGHGDAKIVAKQGRNVKRKDHK